MADQIFKADLLAEAISVQSADRRLLVRNKLRPRIACRKLFRSSPINSPLLKGVLADLSHSAANEAENPKEDNALGRYNPVLGGNPTLITPVIVGHIKSRREVIDT